MAPFTKQQIETALKSKSGPLTPEDVRRVAKNRDAVLKMIAEFPPEHERARRQAQLLFEILEESATGKLNIHPDELRWAAGALIYLAAPIDIVPDQEKGGYADDAAVVALAFTRSEGPVRTFCQLRGLDLAEYS